MPFHWSILLIGTFSHAIFKPTISTVLEVSRPGLVSRPHFWGLGLVSVSYLKGLVLVSVSRFKGLGLARDYPFETTRPAKK